MTRRYRLGRLPATRPHGLADLAVYAKGRLPAPPASVPVPDVAYPVDGNDIYGDCTIAGIAHLLAAWDAEVQEPDRIPDEQEVVAQYSALTGCKAPGDSHDTGLNEADLLNIWHTSGLFAVDTGVACYPPNKIAGYAPVNPRDVVAVHQTIAFYGGAYLGIACPQSAQEQFGAGQPWTYVPGSPVEGGHCIVAVGYTQTALLCATWGGIAEVTYGFVAHFLEEAWAVIPQAFVEAGRGPELDLGTLQADLAQLH